VIHLAAISPLVDVGRSLRGGIYMFWETLWALVLGFCFSGLVQAFVSRAQMQAKLGNHGPAAVARAAGYGMASSSCSYAASAMAKSLFAKGADFVAALVFMIASTNLVVELGIVILVLLGWQFMAAEFVGGPIMIALVALAGGFVLRGPLVEAARRRLDGSTNGSGGDPGNGGAPAGDGERTTWPARLRSPAALSDAAAYAVADFTMLRRELVVGYTVAGFLAVLVPVHVWDALFVHGHGVWTVLENALVGPFIAVVSFVCSIGNVPLAAALWSGGISFGGVISFIFADLIAMPLILIYRRYYGARLALRVVSLLYVVMVLAGLATQGVFGLFGVIPANRTIHVRSAQFAWNYTTYLDIVFIVLAVAAWWLARNRALFSAGHGYATDPVCGMQVRLGDAPAELSRVGTSYVFCSDRCRDRFVADPSRFAVEGDRRGAHRHRSPLPSSWRRNWREPDG
jgi:uncharacterized membrane protein YraQ (UPF0718 family)/YHS domain-containing protein